MTALKIDAGLPPARLKRRKYMSTALLLIDELGFEHCTCRRMEQGARNAEQQECNASCSNERNNNCECHDY